MGVMDDFETHPLVAAGDDPSYVRLLGLFILYIVNIFMPVTIGSTVALSYWGFWEGGNGWYYFILSYLFTVVAACIWMIPAVFMAGHFLFGWLNIFEEARFTVWLIEQWVSNLSFLYHVIGGVFAILLTADN